MTLDHTLSLFFYTHKSVELCYAEIKHITVLVTVNTVGS